jgi:hypothetical protein
VAIQAKPVARRCAAQCEGIERLAEPLLAAADGG